MSRLLEVVPEAKLEPEPEGQEFGCYCFDDLTPVCMVYVEENRPNNAVREREYGGNKNTFKKGGFERDAKRRQLLQGHC